MEIQRIPVTRAGSEPFVEYCNTQLHIMWFPDEVKVEKDIQDVLVNFTPAEKHGVITVLKLFTLYEDYAGEEYWGGRFKKMFNDDIEAVRMASAFSMIENCVHGPFYRKINELLHIDTPEFYLSYVDNPTLKGRMEHIGAIVDDPDDLVSIGMFSLVEGVALYANFSFLKHFQSQGKNKLMNLVRGINFSLRDENLHSVAGAWSFKYKAEKLKNSVPDFNEYMAEVEAKIRKGAELLYQHEVEIIKMIFEQGKIDGITETQMVNFVQSRVNLCLKELGFAKMFEVTYNPISDYFYKALSDFSFADFFTGTSHEYQRNWDDTGFVWKVAA
jgi:ribonucleoside-diphosphate reductase beta chain